MHEAASRQATRTPTLGNDVRRPAVTAGDVGWRRSLPRKGNRMHRSIRHRCAGGLLVLAFGCSEPRIMGVGGAGRGGAGPGGGAGGAAAADASYSIPDADFTFKVP